MLRYTESARSAPQFIDVCGGLPQTPQKTTARLAIAFVPAVGSDAQAPKQQFSREMQTPDKHGMGRHVPGCVIARQTIYAPNAIDVRNHIPRGTIEAKNGVVQARSDLMTCGWAVQGTSRGHVWNASRDCAA